MLALCYAWCYLGTFRDASGYSGDEIVVSVFVISEGPHELEEVVVADKSLVANV